MTRKAMTRTEEAIIKAHREKVVADKEAEKQRQERLKGYLFWCSEGCGFVGENHRCEQWTNITYIPPEAVKAILVDKQARRRGKA